MFKLHPGRILVLVVRAFIAALPESGLRNRLRAVGFRLVSNLSKTSLVDPGDVVVQAGCWRTETLEGWSKVVGPSGRVIAIEADDRNANILRIEAERRRLTNVTVIQKALWNQKDLLTIRTTTKSGNTAVKESGNYSDLLLPEDYQTEKQVPADSLDNLLAELGICHIDHINMTISGAEIQAIEGMEMTLSKPGVRVFIRSCMLGEVDRNPINESVAQMLRSRGLNAVCARQERDRHGSNIFAWRSGSRLAKDTQN